MIPVKAIKKAVALPAAILTLSISSLANAAPSNQSQQLLMQDNTCAYIFKQNSNVGPEAGLDFLISIANIALDEVFSVVDKYLEKRKKQLTATYGVNEILESGLGNGTRCLMLMNGEFGENQSGKVENGIAGFAPKFFTKNKIKRIDSFFAFEVKSTVLSGGEREGVGRLKITPYHASFYNTSAKRQKKNGKMIVATINFETAHRDKKGFQKTEVKKVVDFGEIENGSQKDKFALKSKTIEEFVDSKTLQRPTKINVSIVESEEASLYEKIAVSFYETEKDNIKKTIQKIWGTEEEED